MPVLITVHGAIVLIVSVCGSDEQSHGLTDVLLLVRVARRAARAAAGDVGLSTNSVSGDVDAHGLLLR